MTVMAAILILTRSLVIPAGTAGIQHKDVKPKAQKRNEKSYLWRGDVILS